MRHGNYNYYLTDEELADMRYESSEQLARKFVLGAITTILFGSCFVKAMFILLGV